MSEKSQIDYELPKKILEEINNIAKTKKLSATQKNKLKERIIKEYEKNSFEPGKALSIITAQSIP